MRQKKRNNFELILLCGYKPRWMVEDRGMQRLKVAGQTISVYLELCLCNLIQTGKTRFNDIFCPCYCFFNANYVISLRFCCQMPVVYFLKLTPRSLLTYVHMFHEEKKNFNSYY